MNRLKPSNDFIRMAISIRVTEFPLLLPFLASMYFTLLNKGVLIFFYFFFLELLLLITMLLFAEICISPTPNPPPLPSSHLI